MLPRTPARLVAHHADRSINLRVVCPSTPAQYFHALRRQVHKGVRKPLVILTPKSLLHHRPCASDLSAMGPGKRLVPLIMDGTPEDNMRQHDLRRRFEPLPDEQIRRLVLCSGRVFYLLSQRRRTRKVRVRPLPVSASSAPHHAPL